MNIVTDLREKYQVEDHRIYRHGTWRKIRKLEESAARVLLGIGRTPEELNEDERKRCAMIRAGSKRGTDFTLTTKDIPSFQAGRIEGEEFISSSWKGCAADLSNEMRSSTTKTETKETLDVLT